MGSPDESFDRSAIQTGPLCHADGPATQPPVPVGPLIARHASRVRRSSRFPRYVGVRAAGFGRPLNEADEQFLQPRVAENKQGSWLDRGIAAGNYHLTLSTAR